MGFSVHDDVLDAAWNVIKNNCTRLTLCSTQPTSYEEANATYALASVTVDSSDFTIANGDTSGRKVTVGAQSGFNASATGTAGHVALLDVLNEELLYVTECASQSVTSGNPVTFSAFDLEILDPVAEA